MAKEKALEVLFEDDDFVAVNKPAGLATIPGRAEKDSVLEAIGRQVGLPSSGTADPRIRADWKRADRLAGREGTADARG